MNAIALAGGIALLVFLIDRLRRINWKTSKPEYVALYLGQTLWALGIMLEASRDQIEIYQLGAVSSTLIWLYLTRSAWSLSGNGPPDHVSSAPMPLGKPEPPTLP